MLRNRNKGASRFQNVRIIKKIENNERKVWRFKGPEGIKKEAAIYSVGENCSLLNDRNQLSLKA